jgi:type IV pilus biogenesis protein PilP
MSGESCEVGVLCSLRDRASCTPSTRVLALLVGLGVLSGLSLMLPSAQAQGRAAVQQQAQPVEVTIDTLVRLRQAELQEEFNQRVRRLLPAPPLATAAAAPARAASMPDFYKPAPAPPKRVAAIYGRRGSELADIELPSGQMITVAAGARIEPYQITDINTAGVELVGFVPVPRSAEAPKAVAKQAGKAVQGSQSSAQASRPDRQDAGEAVEVRKRIPVGGTFE